MNMNTLPTWLHVFRVGFAPSLSDAGLQALALALETDDVRLEQGATCRPLPLQCHADLPIAAACAICFCGWQSGEVRTVAEADAFFARACHECDGRLGWPNASREFLNHFDNGDREQVRAELLVEVLIELVARSTRLPLASALAA